MKTEYLLYSQKFCWLSVFLFLFDAGAGVFVTAVVAGTIAIIHPFDAMQRPFLRDIVFYLAAVFCTFSVMWDKEITKIEAIGQAYL